MALHRVLSKNKSLFNHKQSSTCRIGFVLDHPPISPSSKPPYLIDALHREFRTSPDSSTTGLFRRFLQQSREINQIASRNWPMSLTLPVGDKLREKLRSLNNSGGESLQFGSLLPPETTESVELSVMNVRKVLRCAQLEKLRLKLREIPMNSIPYYEFVSICSDGCENRDQGLEFAKMLDESGNVVVLGNVVFLRPDQVVKSVEKLMKEAIITKNDPRKKELENLEKQKAMIDEKAESQVRAELYCGLGYLIIQTLGFMRLTFWELSWDVMEPICFFVTSLHFALAYGFFLRTAKEPSFEGYFQRRFKVKQKKLIEIYNFDMEKYNELCNALYPSSTSYNYTSSSYGSHQHLCH